MPTVSERARTRSDARRSRDDTKDTKNTYPLCPSCLLGRRIELDRAEHVAFGILKEHQRADPGDEALLHDRLAAVGRHRFGRVVDRRDGDGAFVAEHPLPRHELAPLLQRPSDAGILRAVEVGWPPGVERPAEHPLVES